MKYPILFLLHKNKNNPEKDCFIAAFKKHFPFLTREAQEFLPEPLWDLPIGHGFIDNRRSNDSENLYFYSIIY